MEGPGGWMSSQIPLTVADENSTNTRLECFSVDLDGKTFERNCVNLSELAYQNTGHLLPRHIYVLESRGGDTIRFCGQETHLRSIFQQWHIPESFLCRILGPGSLPRFEYLFEPSSAETEQAANNLGFRWGTGHADFVVVFGRYSIHTSTLALCLSSKDILDYKKPNCKISDLSFNSVWELMQRFSKELSEHPLHLIGLLLECCERLVDVRSQSYNTAALTVRKGQDSLLTPHANQWLDSWGFQSRKFGKRIDALFALYDGVSWGKKNCQELVEIGNAFTDLASKAEKLADAVAQNSGGTRYPTRPVLPADLVERAVDRAKHHAKLLQYLQEVIQMQFTHQYNYTAQKDAEATKTISYLTLFFLPSTFVCAIFSTSIFNFEHWDAASGQNAVVSGGWWLFVLSCLALSLGTIALWVWWRGAQILHDRERTDVDAELGVVNLGNAESNR